MTRLLSLWLLLPAAVVFANPHPAANIRLSLPLVTSVTQDGVTWTFDHPVPVGQFVNGDYYVVGPVTVTSITPAPTTFTPYLNGSVLNLPASNSKSGFDSRLNDGSDQSWWFDSSLRVYAPLPLRPGDALVSSISLSSAQYHNVPEVMRAEDMSISPVGSVSILTVLNDQVTADAFRPSYCDRSQKIYYASSLNRGLLPSLAPPNPGMTPTLSQFETWLRRPWLDLNPFLFDAPADYMPSYGMHIAWAMSYASLLLELNFPPAQKVNLTNYMVQYGVDLYGCVQAGYGWPAFGGHRSGRKLPIVFAGILLNDANMKNVSGLYPDRFGEDMQTLYINRLPPPGTYQQAWQGATVIYGGHYGVHTDGTPVSPGLYGPYEHLQPRDWPLLDGDEQLGEAYRRCCTSLSWVGEALAMRLLGAQSTWNYPAFFDYTDRWMFEDDTAAVAEIKRQTGFDYGQGWDQQRQTAGWLQGSFPQYTFIDDMWNAYRGAQTPTPTPTKTPTPSRTPTPTPTPTPSRTPTPTRTPTRTPTPNPTPPPPPTGLVATAISSSQISVTWNASPGATSYELDRKSGGGGFLPIAYPTQTSYTDTGLSGNKTYVYQVRAGAGGLTSGPSAPDLATTILFTDDPLIAGTTVVRAVHVNQLRTAVNAVRAAAGLGAFNGWTDPILQTGANGTPIRAVHISELRGKLEEARGVLGFVDPPFSDPTLTVGVTVVKKIHVDELRLRVK